MPMDQNWKQTEMNYKEQRQKQNPKWLPEHKNDQERSFDIWLMTTRTEMEPQAQEPLICTVSQTRVCCFPVTSGGL